MTPVIEALDLSFAYRGEPIFSNVSFTVNAGDFAALTGSNGTGKSTLLRLLLGELSPLTGAVRVFGEDVRRFRSWPRAGYVPQAGLSQAAGFPATALETVTANLYSKIGPFRPPGRTHRLLALEALERVDMAPYASRLLGELSGGQLQRVMLARALVNAPELLLLDEPTTGVDAQTVDTLFALLGRLNREKGLTILMVTHDLSRAAADAGRVFCLEEGSLVELEQTQVRSELLHKHKHPHPDGGAQGEGGHCHDGSCGHSGL